jgi:hypothetical protein
MNPRSAWRKAIQVYALELLEGVEGELTRESLLNGAQNWKDYSEDGRALIYHDHIAERLCTPSELKRCKGGELPPNSRKTWFECQTLALSQAAALICRTANL